MTDTKKNALAELAERLSPRGETKTLLLVNGRDIIKAQRIIAELAKVEDRRDGETNSDALWMCNDCIAKCRVIAEEGTGNGK